MPAPASTASDPLIPSDDDIRAAVTRALEPFGWDYWRRCDETHSFPDDFARAMAAGGWLGIAMPAELGGSGLGVRQAAVMMESVAASGAGMTGASAIHINIFGPNPIAVHGTPEQKTRFLVPLMSGAERCAFAVTEPDAGLDTSRVRTTATRKGEVYVVRGQKIWTSTAQSAARMMLLARTSPRDEARPMAGLSLFYAPLDRTRVEVREIAKMGRHGVDSNQLFIDDLEVPAADLIGEEGKGFSYLLHGFNPERILIAAEAVGLGRAALRRAADYARGRVVFGRPIGQNQAIQHPLAASWAELEAAWLMVLHAADLYDAGAACGAQANAAKYLAGEAAFRACERAVMTHGGMGYAREFDVERLMREAFIPRIAPVSRELVLSFLGEKVLGLPKSY